MPPPEFSSAIVTQHNIIVVCGIFTNFALEPRDAWCLKGGLTPGVGRFVSHTKGVYYALFLGLQNVGNFEFAVKNEAIVDAPWVRLCTSSPQIRL